MTLSTILASIDAERRNAERRSQTIAARPKWTDAVFACAKCLKRLDEGKSMHRDLKAAAKRRTTSPGGSSVTKVRVVKTRCLGLCPKGAVALASAATLARGEILVLRRGGSPSSALDRLLSPDGFERPDRPPSQNKAS